jgi:hypothetical protein
MGFAPVCESNDLMGYSGRFVAHLEGAKTVQ